MVICIKIEKDNNIQNKEFSNIIESWNDVKDAEKAEKTFFIGKIIIWIFAGTIIAFFISYFFILYKTNSTDINILVDKSIDFFKGISVFLMTVFSSILSFVLGYYFNESKENNPDLKNK